MLTPLMQNFVAESRDALQNISEKLLALEQSPDDAMLLNDLFRIVHTLKGNTGLFDFPQMTISLHAAEDLMDIVRDGKIPYTDKIADLLLDLMDFVSVMLDDIENTGKLSSDFNEEASAKAKSLRDMIKDFVSDDIEKPNEETYSTVSHRAFTASNIPEQLRMALYDESMTGKPIMLIQYTPEEECYFKGEDPFFIVKQTPEIRWFDAYIREMPGDLIEYDAYKCILGFDIISTSDRKDINEHYRYVPDQIRLQALQPHDMICLTGDVENSELYEDYIDDAETYLEQGGMEGLKRATEALLSVASAELRNASILRWIRHLTGGQDNVAIIRVLTESIRSGNLPLFSLSEQAAEDAAAAQETSISEEAMEILIFQMKALNGCKDCCDNEMRQGFLESILISIENTLKASSLTDLLKSFKDIVEKEGCQMVQSLAGWLKDITKIPEEIAEGLLKIEPLEGKPEILIPPIIQEKKEEPRFGRRAEDQIDTKILKVEESKIDRLMNLIGEIVVAKNSLPYLAQRADRIYRVTELSKEIKSQYAVVNRITEELQDAIMQVRMIPVSFVFQRFPRLTRDLSKKLSKEVRLVMEGEDTEADKNVIESLADPLIHIIRNSLDHGIERPDDRADKGKPEAGTIKISARQESDRVIIEIADDGKGIDPEVIKTKAYEKGLISEEKLEKISDEEAVNLVFLPGFSTTEMVSDLSGRGVGMDVVRTGVQKVGGSVRLRSIKDKGTTITLSLPLSMAVSNVMIVETASRRFGLPMDVIIETLNVSKDNISTVKGKMTSVIRGAVIPLVGLNHILEIDKAQMLNEYKEYSVVVINTPLGRVGLIIDDLHGTADIILKPLAGILSSVSAFSGTAILGDGSVLLVLDPKELFLRGRFK